MVLHDQRLDIQDYVGDVFKYTLNRGELVQSAMDFDLRDRTAFQTGKQDPAKSIANRRTKTALKRFRDELAICGCQRAAIASDYTGQFQSTPSNVHL